MTDYRPILEEYFGRFEIDRILDFNEEVDAFRLYLVSPKGKINFMPGFGGIGSGVSGIARPILKTFTDICRNIQEKHDKPVINLEFEVEREYEEDKTRKTGINIHIKTNQQEYYKKLSDILQGAGTCARNYYELLTKGQL